MSSTAAFKPSRLIPQFQAGTQALFNAGVLPDLFAPTKVQQPDLFAPVTGGIADPNASLDSYLQKQMAKYQQGNGSPFMGGQSASLGGDWAGVDQWNDAIAKAAAASGVPINAIKALMKLESGGVADAQSGAGAWGPMQIVGDVWGYGPWMSDPVANIMKGAEILKSYYDKYGNWRDAFRGYHGFGSDGNTTDQEYADIVMANWDQLNNASGGAGFGYGETGAGNNVVAIAQQYVGVAYNWGAIPGKGQDPRTTGWDCSGMTYWLDQNYGDGSLPMGSHYQYQYAQQTGKLFTDLSQLQPGDLVFINTGWQGGAGSELNQAGHVGMYIGNGQIIHAANPEQGTIISPLAAYGNVLGGMHMGWSGGIAAGGVFAGNGGASSGSDYIWNVINRMRGGG